ncbi:hypothetical protein [Campylobacter sp. 19-13652]|uniref:hypothetical protein n=1 Tax=Campylobacter sp. 19-13652 TaxID=2840180 RepID=UPI001C743212|nr:hypothetical protein [Campylobacter sp. 19-13652]BCX78573.1 hypothetical protein LBC_00350 [Campylobacter sp. 19-13652]
MLVQNFFTNCKKALFVSLLALPLLANQAKPPQIEQNSTPNIGSNQVENAFKAGRTYQPDKDAAKGHKR